jgi:hypothetical protein
LLADQRTAIYPYGRCIEYHSISSNDRIKSNTALDTGETESLLCRSNAISAISCLSLCDWISLREINLSNLRTNLTSTMYLRFRFSYLWMSFYHLGFSGSDFSSWYGCDLSNAVSDCQLVGTKGNKTSRTIRVSFFADFCNTCNTGNFAVAMIEKHQIAHSHLILHKVLCDMVP